MKKIITLVFLLISTISISQNREYKNAVNLFNSKQYTEANLIIEKLLNKEFGDLDEEKEFYCLQMSMNGYETLNDIQAAYSKAKIYLDFVNNSSKKFFADKEKAILGAQELLEKLKLRLPVGNKIAQKETSDSNTNNVAEADKSDSNVSTMNKTASDDKTVTLTVSGTGKTLEEAKLNALRSAIEQAFGAFVSSKTEILNDNLVKDEIVSVASGNVQKYDVVSQIELPGVGFATTLNAIVSITKLTSFAESKGVVVEFKGGMFGVKIKLQKLNEESEYIAIRNLLSQTFEMLEKSIDYSLNVKEPKLAANDVYTVGLEVIQNKNANYDNCMNYLIKTLSKISLSDNEANEITKNGKDLCYLSINGQYLRFRNEKSINALFNFSLISSMIAPNTFSIKNNFGIVKIPSYRARIFSAFVNYYPVTVNSQIDFNVELITKPEQVDVNGIPLIEFVKQNGFHIDQLLESVLIANEYDPILRKDKFLQLVPHFNYSNQYTRRNGNNLYFESNYLLSTLEKIESFQIEKIPFSESLLKRELYRESEDRETFGCFLKGTKISTPQGTKFIENINVGDEVICFDDKGNLHTSIVESINSHKNQEVYKYSVWNGEPLYATTNHWVLTSENSFSEIGKLNEMLTLVDTNGGLKPVIKAEYFGNETVYNFIVKDYHTYIANDIRVHNGGKGKSHLNISKN